jgi:hypothetical protein
MGSNATPLNKQIAAFDAANAAADRAVEKILALARETDPSDRARAEQVLAVAEKVGRSGQARNGQLIQLLAQADRLKASGGALAPWIARHLDATPGRAVNIAQSARVIGDLPELSEALSSGEIGTESVRALTRTARAIPASNPDRAKMLTATLELVKREGVSAVNRRVRILEEAADPGRAEKLLAKQRGRSYVRMRELESGMSQLDALLDPVRAKTVRTALDQQTAILRARQIDHTDSASGSGEAQSVEQLQAQALTRLAEASLAANSDQQEGEATAPDTPASPPGGKPPRPPNPHAAFSSLFRPMRRWHPGAGPHQALP